MQTRSISLFFTEGSSDKEYHAAVINDKAVCT